MPLTSGVRDGSYEIQGPLGVGGMGEVYRAHDATLQRDVALKVLPDAFTLDPDRLARFKREAQVLASLNHPNIAAIYGFEEANPGTGSGQIVQALAWSWSRARRSPIGSVRARFRSRRRCRSRGRSRTRWKRPTSRASFIAISNPPTSKCGPTGP